MLEPIAARSETDLEMAERHVTIGEQHIARQRELIYELSQNGHATDDAFAFLKTLEQMQEEHLAHLARLRRSDRDD